MTTHEQTLPKGFVRLSGSVDEVASKLGPLAGLVGTWHGTNGWNMIAVPSMATKTRASFTLLIQNYSETITFTPIGAPVPNRGGTTQQFITGLTYNLTVTDNTTQGILHLENGMWLNMTDIENQPIGPVVESVAPPAKPFTIARQSSIPHGDVVIALGNSATSNGMPTIPVIHGHPDIGKPTFDGYIDPYLFTKFPQFDASNPNTMLQKAIENQKIGNVTTITVDTANKGGAIANIPFLDAHVNPSRFVSTFWIEEVSADGISFSQLQYSQQADLNFLPKFNEPGIIMWPHINVNTLRKQ